MKTKKTTKKTKCKHCTDLVEIASTSISVICSKCTFKLCEGNDLDNSK